MKNWIIKYKVEFVKNIMPSDDLYDSRELAQWYRMWRVLFPSLENPVPSPCESKYYMSTCYREINFHLVKSPAIWLGDLNLKKNLENYLGLFQGVLESQVTLGQLPPTDIIEQVEYYKEVIRKVYQITAPALGSNLSLEFVQDLNLEKHLEAIQAMVKSQVTFGQPPPGNITEQVEYYKEVIRSVWLVAASSVS
jgi:hypothetical protein